MLQYRLFKLELRRWFLERKCEERVFGARRMEEKSSGAKFEKEILRPERVTSISGLKLKVNDGLDIKKYVCGK